MIGHRTRHARRLFDGIAARYEGPAGLLSFWQYARWRRALGRALDLSETDVVLDVATGTGAIAREVTRRYGCRIVGLDQSREMLATASRGGLLVVGGQAERLPFADESFDGLTFSYLMRYVDDPTATLRELVRVLRHGGTVGSVEFGLPRSRAARALWRLYAFRVFPVLARTVSGGWREVGDFLPQSIQQWGLGWSRARQVEMWRDSGIDDVRVRDLSFGAGVIMWGRKR